LPLVVLHHLRHDEVHDRACAEPTRATALADARSRLRDDPPHSGLAHRRHDVRRADRALGDFRLPAPSVALGVGERPEAHKTASWRGSAASTSAGDITSPKTWRSEACCTWSRAGSRTNAVTTCPRASTCSRRCRPVAPVAPNNKRCTTTPQPELPMTRGGAADVLGGGRSPPWDRRKPCHRDGAGSYFLRVRRTLSPPLEDDLHGRRSVCAVLACVLAVTPAPPATV
jgi:hypothetical protein